jgi:hypothetical protein
VAENLGQASAVHDGGFPRPADAISNADSIFFIFIEAAATMGAFPTPTALLTSVSTPQGYSAASAHGRREIVEWLTL